MNLLGKIFIVAIMIMSVVFMTLALMVYATHKNWKDVVERPHRSADPAANGADPVRAIEDGLQSAREPVESAPAMPISTCRPKAIQWPIAVRSMESSSRSHSRATSAWPST